MPHRIVLTALVLAATWLASSALAAPVPYCNHKRYCVNHWTVPAHSNRLVHGSHRLRVNWAFEYGSYIDGKVTVGRATGATSSLETNSAKTASMAIFTPASKDGPFTAMLSNFSARPKHFSIYYYIQFVAN